MGQIFSFILVIFLSWGRKGNLHTNFRVSKNKVYIEKVMLLAHLSPHNHKISLSYQRFERFWRSLSRRPKYVFIPCDFLLEIPRTPYTDQRAIPQNIVHHLFSKGCSIFFQFSHTNPWYHIYMEITYWTTAFSFAVVRQVIKIICFSPY